MKRIQNGNPFHLPKKLSGLISLNPNRKTLEDHIQSSVLKFFVWPVPCLIKQNHPIM